jgi:hypothetical protein
MIDEVTCKYTKDEQGGYCRSYILNSFLSSLICHLISSILSKCYISVKSIIVLNLNECYCRLLGESGEMTGEVEQMQMLEIIHGDIYEIN